MENPSSFRSLVRTWCAPRGKCAACHARTQYRLVHEYEMSLHASKDVNCLDWHQPAADQEKKGHHGFVIAANLTAENCRSCHEAICQQF